MIPTLLKFLHRSKTFILYGLLGGIGALSDLATYAFLVSQVSVQPTLINFVSTSIGIFVSFVLNSRYNFKKTDHLLHRFSAFYVTGLFGTLLSIALLFLLYNVLGFGPLTAKLLTIAPVVIVQFVINKRFSFSDEPRAIWDGVARFLKKNGFLISFLLFILLIFMVNAPYYNFVDENDNILGAQQMVEHHVTIYRGYFSHHMPLTYFIAAPLVAFFGTNLIGVKLLFGVLMFIWALAMSRHLYKDYKLSFYIFLLLSALTQPLAWTHMILAETLVAYAATHAAILLLTSSARKSAYHDSLSLALLGTIPVLASLSFAPVSLVIYLGLLWLVVKEHIYRRAHILFIALTGAIPYALFVLYLVATHSLTEFVSDSISFNTLYYSQFTSDAGKDLYSTIVSIPLSVFSSLRAALTFGSGAVMPFAFMVSAGIIIALAFLVYRKMFFATGLFAALMFVGGARGGFSTAFSASDRARSGEIIALLSILLFSLTVNIILDKASERANERNSPYVSLPLLFIGSTLILLSVSSLALISKNLQDYHRGDSLVSLREEPGSPSTVINLINSDSDYYWIGPIDFSSQIITQSRNASMYRFYTPWVARCDKCSSELLNDIRTNKPKVVVFNENASVWNISVRSYAKPLENILEQDYYQLSDIRLSQFYFISSSKNEINNTLQKVGYKL